MSLQIITLGEARASGIKRYFTGLACPSGHVSERHVVNGDCVECCKARCKRHYSKKGHIYTANRRAKYANDPVYRARQLAGMKATREKCRDEISRKRRERWRNDHAWREKQLAARRGRDQKAQALKFHYGLTLEQFNAMREAQNSCCAICRDAFTETPCVDHCHARDQVRALLCRKCNTGLGSFRDKPAVLRAAIEYLERHS